jgi:hypothetical protein
MVLFNPSGVDATLFYYPRISSWVIHIIALQAITFKAMI